jgi:hypothetical protein
MIFDNPVSRCHQENAGLPVGCFNAMNLARLREYALFLAQKNPQSHGSCSAIHGRTGYTIYYFSNAY